MLEASVIIPAYNRAATVGRAIESVLSQTLQAKEVIVVDDGSVDDTMDVVERYRRHDRRVSGIRQQNGGAGAARNTGIEAASGEWIGLLDSDDAWRPDKLAHAAAIARASPATDLIHSNVEFVQADGRIVTWDRHSPEEMVDPSFLIGSFLMRTSAVLVKRSLLDKVGHWFPTDRATCEDFDLFWRLIAASAGIGYVPSRDVCVHITADGLTRVHEEPRLLRDNIGAMGAVIRWMQDRPRDLAHQTALRGRQYWELRELLALRIEQRAWRSLVADYRYGMRELSAAKAHRAFLSAGAGVLRRAR